MDGISVQVEHSERRSGPLLIRWFRVRAPGAPLGLTWPYVRSTGWQRREAGRQVFAGQRADLFYLDLGSVFDLGDLRPFQPDFLVKGLSAMAGINTLAGLNVHSIEIQVPITDLTSDGTKPANYKAADSTIGVWTTASRRKALIFGNPISEAGPWVQVSRLGMPVINEVIIPMGQKDHWNTQAPVDDAQFGPFYDHPSLAALLNVLYPGAFANIAAYTANPSNTRPDLDAVLLTGVPAGGVRRLPELHWGHQGRPAAVERGDRPCFALVSQHLGRQRWRQCRVPEIHPASDLSRRTHVWVLPRVGREGTVYAAVFPSLPAGDYTVLEPDGSVATTVAVPPNQVTNATWG